MENFSNTGDFCATGISPKPKNSNRKFIFWSFLFFLCVALGYLFLFKAPKDFPIGTIFNVEQGASLRSVSFKLERAHIIRSRVLFETFAIMYGGEKHLIPADYLFDDSFSVFEIARRIAKGERHLAPVKVTIPEGYSLNDMANAYQLRLTNFNKENFLAQAKYKEGYLFPDTYFFFTTDTEKEVIKSMSDNFEKKITTLSKDIVASGKSEKQIIVMASIVEKEAKGDNDRAYISGILWNRLDIGMALQVDAAPETYKKKGLPENPIASPGLEAIIAAIKPKASSYLYYLHDKDGVIHFATSFEEHKKNKAKYLK